MDTKYTASVQFFAKLFVARQNQFMLLCEYILNDCAGLELPEEANLYNALFEMYLSPEVG